jgi:hypothetical protein
MKIKCECSREVMARRDVYMPNYEAITWYCPYCSRGTKLIKYCQDGPTVIYDQRERVAPVADEPRHHRIPIVEYVSERTSVPFVSTAAK